MTWEIIFVLALLAFAIASFLLEKFPVDQIAISVFAALLMAGMLPFAKTLPWVLRPRSPGDPLASSDPGLLSVFANPAPLTIAAMFILSAALDRVGVIETLASSLGKLTKLGYRRFLLVLIFFVAVISAFINNTPVVMVFLPVVLTLSRSLGVPASKLLIPLSYASIFGGTCTLVGTSTNILASGILQDAGEKPISMFELAAVGLPLLVVGTAYLVFFGHKLLPARETLTSILTEEERKEFLTEAFVRQGSPLAGKTVAESRLTQGRNVRVLEVIRNEVSMRVEPRQTVLEEGDRLVLACRPAGFAHTRSIEGLDLRATKGLDTVSAHEGSIVEGVIGPKSKIVGQSIRDINFRQRYRVL
ncbi:MAG: SLC13 family permease, partial [Thermoanaerobaculia bacterium]